MEREYESWAYFIVVGAALLIVTGTVFVAVTGATFGGIFLGALASVAAAVGGLVESLLGHNAMAKSLIGFAGIALLLYAMKRWK